MKPIACSPLALITVLAVAVPARAQNAKARYPAMAPIEQYLMDRQAEIALAKSAAPAAISADAEVLVLGRKGYETAVAGKNGFVCVVERSWQAPFDNAEFWNPKVRAPVCYNAPAARSILPPTVKRQQMILAGLPKSQVVDSITAAFARGELVAPEPGSMGYMMSKTAYLTDRGNLGHVMFFIPLTDEKFYGENPPFIVDANPMERLTTLIVPIGRWSDGSAAPVP